MKQKVHFIRDRPARQIQKKTTYAAIKFEFKEIKNVFDNHFFCLNFLPVQKSLTRLVISYYHKA